MSSKKLSVTTSFSYKKKKAIQQKSEVSETQQSRVSTKKSQFINQVIRQWPSWVSVKQERGIFNPPHIQIQGKPVSFKYSRKIPEPLHIGRCGSIFYEYFNNKEQGLTYFYPNSNICLEKYYVPITQEIKEEAIGQYATNIVGQVYVVPTKDAMEQIENLQKMIEERKYKVQSRFWFLF